MALAFVLALNGHSAEAADQAEESQEMSSFEVPLSPATPMVEKATEQIRATLSELHLAAPLAEQPAEPQLLTTADHRGVLAGRFGQDRSNYALVELPASDGDEAAPGLALARWEGDQWSLHGLWKLQPIWKAEGTTYEESGLPNFVDAQAFRTARLDGDTALWVLVPSSVGKYRQDYAVMRFDAEASCLKWIAFSTEPPEFLPGGWLRLYSDSGRRAIWQEWEFRRWQNGKLLPVGSWHAESPYNNVDPSFVDAECSDHRGRHKYSYRATDGNSDKENESKVMISRDKQKFATVTFVWPPSLDLSQPDIYKDGVEKAFLFEKLTGIPRNLYPDETSTTDKPQPRLEEVAGCRVKGKPEAVKLLSIPAPRKLWKREEAKPPAVDAPGFGS